MTGRSIYAGPIVIATVFVVVSGIYFPTVSNLLWGDKDPGTDALLVIFVVGVLVWNLRDELSLLPIRPFWPGLIGLMGLGFIWLSGQLVFTRIFTQFAVIAMTPMVVVTLLGWRWLIVMAFPFFVLVFALPVWSPLIPTLVKWTANIVELGIRASGVPIHRDGAYFVLPSGSWSIADACSGAMFLSTCLLLGLLYARTMYRSPRKRLLFVAGATIVGVAGNWVRVYLTMMIAHITENRLLRTQHYTFGWLLFAFFLIVLCWIGWRFRDSKGKQLGGISSPHSRAGASVDSSSLVEQRGFQLAAIAVAVLATTVIWPLLEARLSMIDDASETDVAALAPTGGWVRVERPSIMWLPALGSPSQVRIQAFEKRGQFVNVLVGVFRHESWNSKMVSEANQLASWEGAKWSLAQRGVALAGISGNDIEAKTGIVLGAQGRVLVWHWYWIEGVSTGNDLWAKFQQLSVRLKGKRATSAWIAIYTLANTSSDSESAANVLQEFIHDMGESLEVALAVTAR